MHCGFDRLRSEYERSCVANEVNWTTVNQRPKSGLLDSNGW